MLDENNDIDINNKNIKKDSSKFNPLFATEKKGFNRSEYMKDRHENARLRKALIVGLNPDTDLKYNEFFKENNNKIDNMIYGWEIDLEVSYQNEKRVFNIPKSTITIYTLNSYLDKSELEYRAKESLINATSVSTGKGFYDGFKDVLASESKGVRVNIEAKKIRGMEQKKSKIPKEVYENLITQRNFYTRDSQTQVKVKNKTSETNLNLDLFYFN